MKSVRCKKPVIDRSKAPGKVGTFKDIFLYGSFKFPSNGPYAGGIIAQSLAGQGKCISKTKAQSLSVQSSRLARGTGATVTEDMWQASDQTVEGCHTQSEPYSFKFIQLSPATPEELVLTPRNEAYANFKPAKGYALTKRRSEKDHFYTGTERDHDTVL